MISGSGNSRRRHARIRDGRRGRHAWTEREPSTWTERPRRRGPLSARVIVPMAIPMAMGLALGMVLALSGKPAVTRLDQSSLGVKAGHNAVTATNPAMSCELIVPQRMLSARGLAAQYELTGPGGESPASSGCEQSNPNLRAFVQATIVDPKTGALYVYEPLVVTLGSAPAAAPVVPKLPKGAVVDIMIGFTGNSLRLVGAGPNTLADQKCVDGADGSLFGQVAFCNSVAFFAATDQVIATGKLSIPANGDSPVTRQECPTARSFALADQDPGVGVTSEYLLTAAGETAQDNAANRAALSSTTSTQAITDGGDSRLLDSYVLPTLGCASLTAPDLSEGGAPGTSPALDELSAARNQHPPSALAPESDPMTMINGTFSVFKTNLYRLGIGQPFVSSGLAAPFIQSRDGGQQADTPANFCANMLDIQTQFLATNAARLAAVTSPVPAVGDNLLTYMASRLSASYANLRCASYGLKNTVRLTLDRGVATAATFSLTAQQPSGPGTVPAPAQPIPLPTVPQPVALPTTPASTQGTGGTGGIPWWIGTP